MRHRLVLAAVAGVLVVSGCAPADPGTSAPSGTAASAGQVKEPAEPTPSLTVAAVKTYKPASAEGPAENVPLPKKPKKADEFSKAGVEAFTRYWYSLLNYAYETGDTKPLMAVTSKDCARCERAVKNIRVWHEDGRWQAGGRVDLKSADTEFRPESGGYLVLVRLQQAEGKFYSAGGKLHNTSPKVPKVTDIFVARYESSRWRATNILDATGF